MKIRELLSASDAQLEANRARIVAALTGESSTKPVTAETQLRLDLCDIDDERELRAFLSS